MRRTRARKRRSASSLAYVLLALTLASWAEARSASPLPAGSSLLVLGSEDDERAVLVRQAVDFWTAVFDQLGLRSVFGAVDANDALPRRSLETYARTLSQQAGRNASGKGPPAPEDLLAHDADVVVLLSQQKIMPFAWPLTGGRPRLFIALPADADLEIAKHELGHALGLQHRGRAGLMCLPCDPEGTRELTRGEREELRRLYSP